MTNAPESLRTANSQPVPVVEPALPKPRDADVSTSGWWVNWKQSYIVWMGRNYDVAKRVAWVGMYVPICFINTKVNSTSGRH